VLGVGRIGALHAANLTGSIQGARLVALVDPDLIRARSVLEGCGVESELPWVTDDLDLVLKDGSVDAVLIASPTDQHAEHLVRIAQAGKAILCEKPVSLDLGKATAAIEAVKAAGVPMQIAFQRRYDPSYWAASQALKHGDIGALEMFRSVTCDPSPAPMSYLQGSGGIFCDMTIHDIDLALFYGGEVEEVTATGAVRIVPELAAIGDVDTAVLALRYKSGALGVLQSWRRAVYGYEASCELYGSKGKLVVQDGRATGLTRFNDRGACEDYPSGFISRFREAYRLEVQAFVDALLHRREPSPGPDDALASLRVALAATRSLREGRTVKVAEVTA
jgi:myo-inositol 2-dehydrogenase/D-chiro-inositol 1-dehydrogenase